MGLVRAEHPPIGTTQFLGQTFWAGGLMVAAMVYTGIGPYILGRMKLPLAERLHDKVLFADADMQKADWMTAAGTIVGVPGDRCRSLVGGRRRGPAHLRLHRPRRVAEPARCLGCPDGSAGTDLRRQAPHPHPLTVEVVGVLRSMDWVEGAGRGCATRGNVFHVEAFVQPRAGEEGTLDRLEDAAEAHKALDWKINDVVVMPVRELPETIADPAEASD